MSVEGLDMGMEFYEQQDADVVGMHAIGLRDHLSTIS